MNDLVKLLGEENYPIEMYLTFKDGRLVSYKTDNDEWFGDVIDDLVTVLKKLEMITFWDDVPEMTVSVPIWNIDDTDDLYIETFHINDNDETEDLHERGCNVPMKLDDFKVKVYETFGTPLV